VWNSQKKKEIKSAELKKTSERKGGGVLKKKNNSNLNRDFSKKKKQRLAWDRDSTLGRRNNRRRERKGRQGGTPGIPKSERKTVRVKGMGLPKRYQKSHTVKMPISSKKCNHSSRRT